MCVAALFIAAVSSSPVKVEDSLVTASIDNVSEWCHWTNDRKCPDPDVRFYLFTRLNVDESQLIYIDDSWDASNLSSSFFNPQYPSKIIIHGFRADMFLTPLFEMKTGERCCDVACSIYLWAFVEHSHTYVIPSLIIRVPSAWCVQHFLCRLVQLVIELLLSSSRPQYKARRCLHSSTGESYQRCWRCGYSCYWIFSRRSSSELHCEHFEARLSSSSHHRWADVTSPRKL